MRVSGVACDVPLIRIPRVNDVKISGGTERCMCSSVAADAVTARPLSANLTVRKSLRVPIEINQKFVMNCDQRWMSVQPHTITGCARGTSEWRSHRL